MEQPEPEPRGRKVNGERGKRPQRRPAARTGQAMCDAGSSAHRTDATCSAGEGKPRMEILREEVSPVKRRVILSIRRIRY